MCILGQDTLTWKTPLHVCSISNHLWPYVESFYTADLCLFDNVSTQMPRTVATHLNFELKVEELKGRPSLGIEPRTPSLCS